jgi:hypothetical protein
LHVENPGDFLFASSGMILIFHNSADSGIWDGLELVVEGPGLSVFSESTDTFFYECCSKE